MQQKATVELKHKGGSSLRIAGELMPETPLIHHILAALLNEEDPPKIDVEFTVDKVTAIIRYSVVFTHSEDVLSLGKIAHDMEVAALNAGMKVADYVKHLAASKEAQFRAEKAAAKKAAKE